MKALDNALALANKDGKDDGVSLYIAEKKKESESKLTKENYSFDKVKIDLDNSFLDDEDDFSNKKMYNSNNQRISKKKN